MRFPRFIPAVLGLALGLLAAAPVRAGATGDAAGPRPNILFQLQKQNLAHPWLRVTVDAARLDLRAERMDELGLSGLRSRAPGPAAPPLIPWRSIARIDEVVTQAQRGQLLGVIAGGTLGAIVGNTIGSSLRTHPANGRAYTVGDQSSGGHGGTGAALGIVVIGGIGAWQGRRWGERRSHELPWYVVAPAPAHEGVPAPAASETLVAGTVPDSSVVRPSAPEPVRSPAPAGHDLSPAVARVCASIGRDDLIRVRGDFGEFQGFASVVGPDGLEGLRAMRGHERHAAASVPAGLVTWDRIERVDRRGRGWRKGALVGGLALGTLGGWLGYLEATQGLFEPNRSAPLEAAGITVGSFGYVGFFGAVVGAGVGLCFPAWLHVYAGPVAVATRR